MFLDARLEFAKAQTVRTIGTHNSTNVVDSTYARDLGSGQPIWLVVTVDTAVASAGNATVKFQLVSDGSATPVTSAGTQTVHAASGAIAKGKLTAGTVAYQVALPIEGEDYERYLGVQFVVGTAALTAGAFSAQLTLTPRKHHHYPDAI